MKYGNISRGLIEINDSELYTFGFMERAQGNKRTFSARVLIIYLISPFA